MKVMMMDLKWGKFHQTDYDHTRTGYIQVQHCDGESAIEIVKTMTTAFMIEFWYCDIDEDSLTEILKISSTEIYITNNQNQLGESVLLDLFEVYSDPTLHSLRIDSNSLRHEIDYLLENWMHGRYHVADSLKIRFYVSRLH